ncbi:hypothetical protein T552_02446 [Pneumocystis carinii B80]|uniref:Uncharacterized protein n=1 Tax=Pneumocystis carinii (strain B80) TaxID=1408658 RepID=A0A0W4ZF04_PNEC8|nr:hypothetical protein T552_02446 [Pneumocystis carinii B80]KTW26956.1 hypothetical protein T552_02446 [Pneumocystis carinii B80]
MGILMIVAALHSDDPNKYFHGDISSTFTGINTYIPKKSFSVIRKAIDGIAKEYEFKVRNCLMRFPPYINIIPRMIFMIKPRFYERDTYDPILYENG